MSDDHGKDSTKSKRTTSANAPPQRLCVVRSAPGAQVISGTFLRRIVAAAPAGRRDEFRELLLEALVQCVAFDHLNWAGKVAAAARVRARRLKSLSTRMRTIAAEAKDLAERDDGRALDTMALLFSGMLRGANFADVYWASPTVAGAIEKCAERADRQVSAIGRYRRRFIPAARTTYIKLLCGWIHEYTGRHMDRALAELLMDAYHAAGRTVPRFTAAQISKIRKRGPR